MFETLRTPVLVAPMAGGPSTPELVAAAGKAGAGAFLAAGYLKAPALAAQIERVRELGAEEFGVNLFVPGRESTVDTSAYERVIAEEARRHGVEPGTPSWDDDDYPAKLETVVAQRVPWVSFTFGAPSPSAVDSLHAAGSAVLVTVTGPDEAKIAAATGADALCVQGFEAGAHRGLLADDAEDPAGGEIYGLLAALRLVRAAVDLPLVAAGGLVHGADVAAVLAGGAVAAQLGTAFLRADEAGTQQAHRRALAEGGRKTRFTRAFSGRPARGLRNRFLDENSGSAPAAYPQVNNLTRPVRAAAGKAGDAEMLSLWAGQTYELATGGTVAEIVARLGTEAREAASAAARRLG